MKWEKPTAVEGGGQKLPAAWLKPHYLEAFNLLFRVENALRVLVYVVLKKHQGAEWTNATVETTGGPSSVSKISKQRKAQASTFGYLGYPTTCPVMWLSTGELIGVITSGAYWPIFAPVFPGAKRVTEMKFDEITSVRNDLAHFRAISPDDVDTVKQSARHILSHAEGVISELINCPETVASNSEETWFKGLRTLGTDRSTLRFNQSRDGDWIKVSIVSECPVLRHREFYRRHNFQVLSPSGAAVVSEFPAIRDRAILCVEDFRAGPIEMDGQLELQAAIRLVFASTTLTDELEEISNQLRDVMAKIAEEMDLIEQDNLARGKLVRPSYLNCTIREGGDYGFVDTNPLASGYTADDPPEWWGQLNRVPSDFVSTTTTYPWMPEDVSKDELPF